MECSFLFSCISGPSVNLGHYVAHILAKDENLQPRFFRISDTNQITKSKQEDLDKCQLFFYKRIDQNPASTTY